MALAIDDVNTETASSTVSSGEGVDSQNGVNVASPATGSEQTDVKTEKTLSDVVNNTFKELTSSVDESSQGKKPDEKNVQAVDGEEKTATVETGEKIEGQEKTEQKGEDKGPIPYERFQQTIQEKNQLAEQIKQLEPLVQAQYSINEYCRSQNLTQEEFGQWVEIAALVKNNPEQALVKLQPYLEQLKAYNGEILPPEYQKAVDNGEISLDYAKRLAAAEKKQEFAQKRVQMTEAQQVASQKAQFQNELKSSFASWVQSKISTSTDFRPKASESEPDGAYELFLNKFAVEAPRAEIKSASDLIAVAEKALAAVKASVGRFGPKPVANGQKILRSSQSNSTEQTAPKTLKDVVMQTAARHGL